MYFEFPYDLSIILWKDEMAKKNLNNWHFYVFVTLIIIFYTLLVYLSASNIPNLTLLAAPVSVAVVVFFWRHQELLKSRAVSAEIMFKAFHNYAIKFGELYYQTIPSLEKQDSLTQMDLDFLNDEFKDFKKLRNIYFVERESFYRIAGIPIEIKNSINREFTAFNSLHSNLSDFLNSKSLDIKKLKSKNDDSKDMLDNVFVETIGRKIEELIKPYIWYQ